MPRDWKNDPEAIRRYCTCGQGMGYEYKPGMSLSQRQAEGPWRVMRLLNSMCKLHGDDPAHDLPPEFP